MPFSLRLDPDTDARIRRLSARTGRSKAQVVREALAQYEADARAIPGPGDTAFDRLKSYLGVVGTGGANLSVETHAKYRKRLQQKQYARRAR